MVQNHRKCAINHYAYIYNELVWNVLKEHHRRRSEAVPFARSASVGARATVPGALGRRLLRQLQPSAAACARRAVHRPVRVWVSEMRYWRINNTAPAHVCQALVRIRFCSPATAASHGKVKSYRVPWWAHMTTSVPVTWCAFHRTEGAG